MKTTRSFFSYVTFFLMVSMVCVGAANAATLNWTGGGTDPNDFAELANWSGTPTGGTIDTLSLVDEYVVDDATFLMSRTDPMTPGARLNFREGGSLTFDQGSLTLTGGTAGIGLLETPDSFGSLVLNSGDIKAQFLAELNTTLGGTGVLTLNGGGNPINISTINITSADATLNMLGETVEQFTNEHLGKITVNGAPAVMNANLSVVSDGGSGSIVTAIPEPGSLALLALGSLGLALYRRRS